MVVTREEDVVYHKNLPLVKAYLILLTSMHIIFTIFANITCPITRSPFTLQRRNMKKKKKEEIQNYLIYESTIKHPLIVEFRKIVEMHGYIQE